MSHHVIWSHVIISTSSCCTWAIMSSHIISACHVTSLTSSWAALHPYCQPVLAVHEPSCYLIPYHVISCHVMSRRSTSSILSTSSCCMWAIMSCYVISSHVIICNVIPCHVLTGSTARYHIQSTALMIFSLETSWRGSAWSWTKWLEDEIHEI